MARTLPLALAALALVFAVTLAGCGGEEDVSATPETVEGTLPEQETETEAAPNLEGGDAAAGEEVFASAGCGSCHTYEPAGSSAEIGPNLDESLAGADAQFTYTSIVDPSAEIAEGFEAGVMPETYGDQFDEQQLADLVAFLQPER